MHDHITTRHAQLVAARHANAIRIQQLRGALAQAEQQDYGLAIALGELERLLPELSARPIRFSCAKTLPSINM
jgi:hypothetical protein